MSRVFDLLVVDDDPAQLRLVAASLNELRLEHRCHFALNGNEALAFLRRGAPFESVPRPDLILLDLNMPGMSGCDVLREVKTDLRFRSIPVVMLSSSEAVNDVTSCYREHANVYIRKPADLEGAVKLLRNIHQFWAESAVVPRYPAAT